MCCWTIPGHVVGTKVLAAPVSRLGDTPNVVQPFIAPMVLERERGRNWTFYSLHPEDYTTNEQMDWHDSGIPCQRVICCCRWRIVEPILDRETTGLPRWFVAASIANKKATAVATETWANGNLFSELYHYTVVLVLLLVFDFNKSMAN